MDKRYLKSIIDKYYLEGLIEQVLFKINNNTLCIDFISPTKNLVGQLFSNIELPNGEFKINNTTQLNKLLNILDDEIFLERKQIRKGFDCLFFKDSKYELEYILADNSLQQQIPSINEPEYDIELHINEEQIKMFATAKKALDNDIVVIDCCDSYVTFNIGGDVEYSNKILLKFPTLKNGIPGIEMKFNANYIKSILTSNNNLTEGKCFISEKGLMKFTFKSDDIDVKYFLVAEQ